MLHLLASAIPFPGSPSARRSGLPLLLVAWAALCAPGCGARVEVGEAQPEEAKSLPPEMEPTENPPEPPPAPTNTGGSSSQPAAPPDCTAADAEKRAVHDAWPLIANDFGSLTGKTFAGYIEGGPDVTLTIDGSGNASLLAGEPAPAPVADASYLCGDGLQNFSQCEPRFRFPPAEGGTYPIHGATFTADRLLLPIQLGSAYEGWCALQTPHLWEGCYFDIWPSTGFSYTSSTGYCTIGENEMQVDCGWLELATLGVCGCTSSACFATIYESTGSRIDAHFDDASGELSGSVIEENGDRYPIRLSEVTE